MICIIRCLIWELGLLYFSLNTPQPQFLHSETGIYRQTQLHYVEGQFQCNGEIWS